MMRSPSSIIRKSTIALVLFLAIRASSSLLYPIQSSSCLRVFVLSACDSRYQVYLAPWLQRLVSRVRIDFAVDGDRHLVELGGKFRKFPGQRGKQIDDSRRLDFDDRQSTGERRQTAWQMHSSHQLVSFQLSDCSFQPVMLAAES